MTPSRIAWSFLFVAVLAAVVAAQGRVIATPSSPEPFASAALVADDATPTPSPLRMLALVRNRFRSHRPPPAFESYRIVRAQLAGNGYPDYANSYTYDVWVRNSDRAALARKVFPNDFFGFLEFQRPAFNEDRDPGPPTADLFEPAPATPHPVEFVPTPEVATTPIPVIASVRAVGEADYTVSSVAYEGDQIHLTLTPRRDPMRNRLRELFVDRQTLDLKKVVATDRLFVPDHDPYPVTFTITLDMMRGIPIVTHIHGVVGGGYTDEGGIVDYDFQNIEFPKSMPNWYFDKRNYAAHKDDAPE